MAKENITFELDGVPAGTPANLDGINLSAQWGTREGQEESEISTSSIEFVLEDAKRLIQHVNDGLSGGVGIFEGLPYKINLDSTNIFNGYVDLTDDAQFIENEKGRCGKDLKIRQGLKSQLGCYAVSSYVSIPNEVLGAP